MTLVDNCRKEVHVAISEKFNAWRKTKKLNAGSGARDGA